MVDDSIFDKRGEVGSSPWHWGEGTQYLPIHDVDALAREFDQHNGDPPMSPQRVHEIRQQFGGSATGMMYLQQTYAPPKL